MSRRVQLALAVALALHLLPLWAIRIDAQPRPVAHTPRYGRVSLRLGPPLADPGLPASIEGTPARRITIQQRRIIHVPDRLPVVRLPEPRLPNVPPPPRHVRPPALPAGPEPAQPLFDALAAETSAGAHAVPVRGGSLRLYFLRPGETAADALRSAGPPLILSAAEGQPPADGGGVTWRELPPEHPLFRRPQNVRGWWTAVGGRACLGRSGGKVVALWLSPAVRAGWEARVPEALALWDNLAAEPGLTPLLSRAASGTAARPARRTPPPGRPAPAGGR